MKRIHLFEVEDFAWFPGWLRDCGTRYIVTMHKILGTAPQLAEILARGLRATNQNEILDLCSGGGGPMPEVVKLLEEKHGFKDLKLTLSDLYPHAAFSAEVNGKGDPDFKYLTTPVNAAEVPDNQEGLRTMVCSMHHMRPEVAKSILADAKADRKPICIFEISDNSFPKWIWWTAIPVNYIMTYFITLLVRPMTWQQLVFTYLIPLLPAFIAWDGAVSNARTYTLDDMKILLQGLETDDYKWEMGVIKGKGKKLYLLGLPV
ncbi:MAG: hypothetical protein H6581_22465 [Bacteroidia bacterium]|nr:hypothetical protein [Bacteroidia bacterium]